MIPPVCYKPPAGLASPVTLISPLPPPPRLAKGVVALCTPAPATRAGSQWNPAEIKAAQAHWQKLMAANPEHPLWRAPQTPKPLMEEMQRLWKKWQAMSVKSMVTDKKVENLRNALEGINLFERASVHPFHQPLLYLTQGILGLRTHPIEEKLTLHKQRAAAMRMFFREISPVMSQATNPEDPYTLTSLARAWGLVNVLEPPPPKGNFRVPPKSNVKPPEEVFDAVKAFDLLFHTQRAECMARWQAWLPWANKRKLQQLQQVNATMAGTLQAMLEVAPFYYPIDSRYIHNFRDRPFPYWLRVRSDLTHLLQPVQRHPQHFNWPNVLKTGEAYWTPALLQQLSPADFSALSPDLQCKLTAWVAQQKTSGAWEGKRPAWFPSTKPPQGSP